MFGLDNKSGINVMPPIAPADSQTPLWFTEGGAGLSATYPGQDWFNQIQAELLNVLNEAGITPEKGKLNQLSLSIKAIISRDYATKSDVDKKLDKSKVTNSLINSRELVPTTALLIDNLALKQPVGDYQEAGYSYSKTESDNKYQPKGDYARATDLNSLISVGDFMFTSNSEGSITPPWYSANGDRYGIETRVGKVLKAQSAEWKRAWNVVETAETITLPALLQPDGRMPFLRPVNGTSRKPGSVMGDTIRNFTGELGYEANYGLTTGERDVNGVFRAIGASKGSFKGGGGGRSLNIMFDPSTVVPTGPENKPLDVGAVLKIYLGVKP
ncbi:TPA: hypothetical protein ACF5RZ_000681 [Morganella morganii]